MTLLMTSLLSYGSSNPNCGGKSTTTCKSKKMFSTFLSTEQFVGRAETIQLQALYLTSLE